MSKMATISNPSTSIQKLSVLSYHNNTKNACVIYRPDTLRVNKFSDHFEKLLQFLSSLWSETNIFGDFIDTFIDDTDSRKCTNLLKAFGFEVRNNLPTRITINSKSCIDHIITQNNNIHTDTIKTTKSDHFTVMADRYQTRV